MSSEKVPGFFRMSIVTGLTFAAVAAVIPGLIGCVIATDDYLRRQSKQEFEQEQRIKVNRVVALEAAGDYRGCITQAEQVSPEATIHWVAQMRLSHCQTKLAAILLNQARQDAAKGEFAQAIEEASQIAVGSDQYSEAQQLIQQWSERILEIAWSYYWQPVNQLDQALAIAGAIPPGSSTYEKAQTQMQEWRQLWADNHWYWVAAYQALNLEQFDAALIQAQQIKDHPFWTHNRSSLIQTLQQKRLQQQHETVWNTAENLLEQGEPANAIVAVTQLPDVFPWRERKQQLIDRAEAKQRQVVLCQTLSIGLFSCS